MKNNYVRDKWGENYAVKSTDEYWTTGRNFCIFDPPESHPAPRCDLICDFTARVWVCKSLTHSNSMSVGVEEYALKANTLFTVFHMN